MTFIFGNVWKLFFITALGKGSKKNKKNMESSISWGGVKVNFLLFFWTLPLLKSQHCFHLDHFSIFFDLKPTVLHERYSQWLLIIAHWTIFQIKYCRAILMKEEISISKTYLYYLLYYISKSKFELVWVD